MLPTETPATARTTGSTPLPRAREDLDGYIRRVVEEKIDLIKERGENAFKPLMGVIMKEFRGKVDGKVVAEKLMKAIKEVLIQLNS